MNYQNLKCSELKDLLAKRGLPSHGKKNELLERLLKYEEENSNALRREKNENNSNIYAEEKNKKKLEKGTVDMTQKKNEKENKSSNELYERSSNQNNNMGHCLLNDKNNSDTQKLEIRNNTQNNSVTFFGKNSTPQNKSSKGCDDKNSQNKQQKSEKTNETYNEKKEITAIPKLKVSNSSLSATNKVEKNLVVIGGNNNLTEQEKRELRKKRFGIVSKDEILESRARKFSIVTKSIEDENKRKRAERFGLNLLGLDDPETKRRRAERFGLFPEIQPNRMEERKVRFQLS